MPVRVVMEGGPYPGLARADVLQRARAMLDTLGLSKSELSILLTGDEQMRILNRLYRKKDRPTDVLAFSQREGELAARAGRLLGDVVISIPTARRQADARGQELRSEVAMLLAHGLLHLLGWDHVTAAEDRRMRKETARLCLAAAKRSLARAPARPEAKTGASVHRVSPPGRARRRSP
ncbi:MAG: rRNA maturation RNase YbeY [Myxococcota bacterium]|nr:rRNA maturation RNase YbeY [Myxococcota bacterium]